MTYDEQLANKVREALSLVPDVVEKKCSRVSPAWLKERCVSVGNEELMCRIDPSIFEDVLERNGCRPWCMAGG